MNQPLPSIGETPAGRKCRQQGPSPSPYRRHAILAALCYEKKIVIVAANHLRGAAHTPHTLSEDGDPVDVLVVTPLPLISGSVIRCRPLGMLKMSDEAGVDAKLVAVPVDKLSPLYKDCKSTDDLPPSLLAQIAHFFEHYKDLENGKWVKVEGWSGVDEAKAEIVSSITRYQEAPKKPGF
ncbi:MAG: inorganic diphosphatase [Gammaproteobacteria bacterium]